MQGPGGDYSSKVKFGLLGYGKVAALHAKALAASGNAELVAVCGRDAAKAAAFAQRQGIAARGSVDEMAERDGVRAVLITTPHPQHMEGVLSAAAAGCHALVEKPMALTVAECDTMIAAAAAARVKLGVVSQRRWYPAVQRVRRAIDEGLLGTPSLAQVTMLGWRDEEYYSSDLWRGKWDSEGGGVLVNQAPHQIDLMTWFMGPVAEVSAYWGNINHPYIEVEDSAVAAIRFKSGGMGSLMVSNSQKPGIYAKVHIHGSSGASAGVQTDGGAMFIAGRSGILEPPVTDIWTVPGQADRIAAWKEQDEAFFRSIDPVCHFFTLQIEDFAAAILEGRECAVRGEDGREAVRLMEGIYRAGRGGSPVRFA